MESEEKKKIEEESYHKDVKGERWWYGDILLHFVPLHLTFHIMPPPTVFREYLKTAARSAARFRVPAHKSRVHLVCKF